MPLKYWFIILETREGFEKPLPGFHGFPILKVYNKDI
jgi:hypothetical protein